MLSLTGVSSKQLAMLDSSLRANPDINILSSTNLTTIISDMVAF